MPVARIASNTTKEYPCTMCGSSGNIVREGDNPRLKCNDCGFMYDGNDSLELVKRGEVPEGPPEIQDPEPKVERATIEEFEAEYGTLLPRDNDQLIQPLPLAVPLPRNPVYLLLSKDRKYFEVLTKRTYKQKILEWEAIGRKYDIFQLNKSEYSVNVDIK